MRWQPRQGKGNAVRQMLRDIDADCYLMVDGDDTYPAESAPELVRPILNGTADHVVGAAYRAGRTETRTMRSLQWA